MDIGEWMTFLDHMGLFDSTRIGKSLSRYMRYIRHICYMRHTRYTRYTRAGKSLHDPSLSCGTHRYSPYYMPARL